MGDKASAQAIKDFLGEAEEIIEKLNVDLVSLGDSAENGDSDPDLVNGIFRGAHSIKGLAGMFGFDDISGLAHQMENLLDCLRLGKVRLSPGLVETLFDGLESLTRLVHGKSEDDHFSLDLNPVLARIQAAANGPGQEDISLSRFGITPEILSVLTEYEEHRLLDNAQRGRTLLRVRATFDLTTFDQELAEISETLKKHGEVISTLPCAGDSADKIAFQLICGSSLGAEQIREKLENTDLVVETLCGGGEGRKSPASQPAAAPRPSAESGGESIPVRNDILGAENGEAGGGSLRSISRTVRVDIDKLDHLMNIVGELVLSKGTIANICQNLKSEGDSSLAGDLAKATRTLERRLHELQQGVMDVRMVPVGQLFEKMNRIVRRVSSELKKKVTLDVRGVDTELDKLIVEDLSDPLMHIIRNSLDHGIESAAERRANGKPEKGTICLWASQKGNHVVIEVRDDGRGIDPEKVRRKAVEKGLVSEHAELSRDQVFDLIFSPGFSTKDQVSDLSGRGVGMDVVKNNISMLSGMIEMDSTPGQGTTLSITLPITLAIIKALIVKVRGNTYAIPITSVLETLMVEASSIKTIERREVIELRNSTLPLLWLDRTFKLSAEPGEGKRHFIAVVGLAEKKIGIVVDELLGQQDVVIKSLGDSLSFVRGIAGAADLGNQKTILVLDVGGLMSEALRGDASFYV
ncbi:chemotaxis protein CheA [Desulfuromonas versatilis]|uniref:histidine kinase n=1 Tax=Desulfuromonas versatilis TaxID=2802975 RepID=A0ABM8HQ68_9BACT|nr:chemotaxis protein CheA [Desulfuromonas versatilis]BCR05126.1 chemotaxis protein CheA [Desulfuromonas versatilis]